MLGGDSLYNPYVFPGNNPVGNLDPMGNEVWLKLEYAWVEKGYALYDEVPQEARPLLDELIEDDITYKFRDLAFLIKHLMAQVRADKARPAREAAESQQAYEAYRAKQDRIQMAKASADSRRAEGRSPSFKNR